MQRLVIVGSMLALGCGPTITDVSGESSTGTATTRGRTTTSGPDRTTHDSASSGTSGPIHGTTVPDPYLDVPGDDTGCTPWATMGCGTLQSTEALVAITPIGSFDLALSAFASLAGCAYCVDSANASRIWVSNEAGTLDALEPGDSLRDGIRIDFPESTPFEGPLGVPVDVQVTAFRDGMTATADALVEIDDFPTPADLGEPFDPTSAFVLHGIVVASHPEWDFSGAFAAHYCPQANEYYICE